MATNLREGKTDVSNENFSSRTANINSKRSLKLFYAVGSGDVVGSFRHWKKGEEDPNELSVTYASQFFSLAHEALVIGAHPRHDRDQQGQITVEHVPLPTKMGLSYLFHAWKHGLQLMWRARRYGATVCLLTDVIPWGIWALVPKFGIPTILSFHQAPLNPFHTPSRGQMLIHFFAKRLFTKSILIAQRGRSAEQLIPYSPIPFLPTYIPSRFKKRKPQPKTVLYCGRLEADKGAA
ncbi:MAG: hypothetical protein KDK65_03850, partial [Chlamydiia bacterium]|nr:hypothetical protein [Chlamydiia bacterium]